MRTLAAALTALLLSAAPAAAVVEIHGHRGGPLIDGVPTTPEDAQPAFDLGNDIGADWIELDAKVTSDGVPVIIHDAQLDRTTDCTGNVADRTAAELAACHVDVIGAEATTKPVPGSRVPIPRLAAVLAWAKANGVRLNLEIKNIPTDPDFDSSPAFARTVLDAIKAADFPRDRLLIQSFWPPNLDEAKAYGYQTLFLSLAQTNDQSVEYAQTRGYDVVSPAWPVEDPKSYVQRAHAAGLEVVPYTFNKADEITEAVLAGVDGVITNDIVVAERVIRGVDCLTARAREANMVRNLRNARLARSRARTRRARRDADAVVKRVNLKRQSLKRVRRRVCNGH